ncbi:hypothetical protein FACS189461_0030 [Spirochaetia bacterium]|nr:hypothetical protein FACS189461_0030 [Spirochaetia bacterium]
MTAIVIAEDNLTFLDKITTWVLREPGMELLYFARNGMALLQDIISKKPLPDVISCFPRYLIDIFLSY